MSGAVDVDVLWCDRCGEAADTGTHDSCAAARAWEPPRFCVRCRRRMKVQVLPAGWSARCVAHGESRHDGTGAGR
ncbi:hypothetical protein O7632_23040 [Solwaraspora sp. WMMD406]|uniref:biotin synthase auxiliary protein BsaP n=1 Tax=Solwaraspora sp. WMMD406 TaxID=3016095 RepID=UPI0024162CFC|nr:hypothetical protein [Solwaraspora sp. WMMD406]MDG4766950.1 hypothetical protein [Solwaraspora sp. WMMD406]